MFCSFVDREEKNSVAECGARESALQGADHIGPAGKRNESRTRQQSCTRVISAVRNCTFPVIHALSCAQRVLSANC